jgi:prepilin-type N-terminal cleavage/methylation domain-containing protein
MPLRCIEVGHEIETVAVPNDRAWSSRWQERHRRALPERTARRLAHRAVSAPSRRSRPITLHRVPHMFLRPCPTQPRSLTSRRRGFTLPEILIVIVLISLLALVAIPRFSTASGKRHMESARMRVAAAVATARQAAIQKGQTVQLKITNNRVTVKPTGTDTTNLVSPVPLDTLYKVTVSNVSDPFTVDFSARGFASLGSTATIRLARPGVANDSVVVLRSGMVQR